ncbi:hypothetical protein AB0M10_25215 [Streptomyces sp. NPDC051840]
MTTCRFVSVAAYRWRLRRSHRQVSSALIHVLCDPARMGSIGR